MVGQTADRRALLAGVMIAAALLCVAPLARGQDCRWEAIPGATFAGRVWAIAEFDEGAGPRLFVGGGFGESLSSLTADIVRWDGAEWTEVGAGLSSTAQALIVWDDGTGPALYAAGSFSRAGEVTGANGIAKWDGERWSGLGSGLRGEDPSHGRTGQALAVFDDGSGPALYVAGTFSEAGGVPARNVARWDGRGWSAVGGGIPGYQLRALAVHDDGSGPALYAGGYTPGGVWRWDGDSWQALGLGNIDAMGTFDDGAGEALYIGTQGFGGLNRWDGEAWSLVDGGTNATVQSLQVFDDGPGPALFVGGAFLTAGGKEVWGIARWDGREWSDLDGGVYYDRGWFVDAMAGFNDGSGPALYVGGLFEEVSLSAPLPVENLARWRCDTSVCYADCDRSGELDVFDFLCFQNEFAAMSPYADCDDSGGHDVFDFLCFQNEFAAGCE